MCRCSGNTICRAYIAIGGQCVRLKADRKPMTSIGGQCIRLEIDSQTQQMLWSTAANKPFSDTLPRSIAVDPSAVPLACGQCNNRYKNPNHLKRHMQYECGQEPKMLCVFCQSKFKRPDSLRRHMLQSCPNKNAFAVEMCKYKFQVEKAD